MQRAEPTGTHVCHGCDGLGYTVEGAEPIVINGVKTDRSRKVPCDLCEGRGQIPSSALMGLQHERRQRWRSPSLRMGTEALKREQGLGRPRLGPSVELSR